MVWRILQFILGAALAGGGGYLAWMQRDAVGSLLPPGPSGLPLLFLVGVIGVTSGIVFLVSAVHPRPNQRHARDAAAARDEAALQEADRYYSERSRAADRDWRSGDISPPPAAPAPVAQQPVAAQAVAAPPSPPKPAVLAPQPVAVQPPPQPVPPPPKPVVSAPPPQPAKVQPVVAPQPVTQPPPPPKPAAPVAPPPSPQTQVMQAAPANPFPATVTLAPLPRAEGPVADQALTAIRTAIAQGKLAEAERMLYAARETATGLDLAKLTAIGGDHAAALGQPKHARWLWRLAMKRFGELGALGLPEAKAVQDSLAK